MAASSNVRPSLITINASELASILNRHRYQPRSETMLKVWQRADTRTFCLAKGLENRREISALILRLHEAQIGKTKEALTKILVDNWDEDDEAFIKVMKEIFADPKSDLYWVFLNIRSKILRTLKALSLQNYKEQKLLDDAQIQTNELIQEVKKLAENEKKPVCESVKEFCEKKGIKDPEVTKALESKITKDRGTKLESKAVEVFGKLHDMEFDEVDIDILQSKHMECDGVEWTLQGRADALTQDTVVEVKNRKNRFMAPDYDLLQLQAYLFLYNKEIGILLERLNEENKETAVEFDVEQWVNEVIPGLKEFVQELNNIIVKNKERFFEPSLPSLVQEPMTNVSPSKRSSNNDDCPVQEKKPCSSSDVAKQAQKDLLESSSDNSLALDNKPCPESQVYDVTPGQDGHSQDEDMDNLNKLVNDLVSNDSWWYKYVKL